MGKILGVEILDASKNIQDFKPRKPGLLKDKSLVFENKEIDTKYYGAVINDI